MDPEIKSACIRAAAKLGFGLSIVIALVGIRIVTATPDGVEAGLEKLEELEEEIAAEAITQQKAGSAVRIPVRDDPPAADADRSLVGQLGGAVRGRLGSGDDATHGDDSLVSCRLGGSTQYMRAHDCAMRGGRAEVVSLER